MLSTIIHGRLKSIRPTVKQITWSRFNSANRRSIEVDKSGIPTNPSWSVHDLLSSYPRPTLPAATLKRLHERAALIPPEEGTKRHAELTREMEEMIRLVEAVKLVDVDKMQMRADLTSTAQDSHGPDAEREVVPDGRVWPEGVGIALSSNTGEVEPKDGAFGENLLKHAEHTIDGFYVVETDRRQ
ncbi:hypothetical protein BD410DRAFT_6854 [Rickenella mellea]|uniref:Uncharacterized protein n=1 Tax=Rickenella mellea TaxID=50990 RepID=A0A4R5XDN2_9AGAM|nr:hypothetical protein BD410DRAFT_6854 [Rickenella mellea]